MSGSTRALVLFSGGQDSTTCLAWALDRYESVETIGFDYGQRHHVEMSCRMSVRHHFTNRFPEWAGRLGDDHVLAIPVLAKIGDTALTAEAAIVFLESGLPNTFVPGRNLLFLTLAAAVAYRRGIGVLVGGMCDTDYSGYPDCRENTIKATQDSLSLGLDRQIYIETPLMHLTKSETWELARTLGGEALVQLIITETHTCYLGVRAVLHAWGYGCGACPACELRAAGFARWREST
jgi:7-cyano-7-deazaguanine synthase